MRDEPFAAENSNPRPALAPLAVTLVWLAAGAALAVALYAGFRRTAGTVFPVATVRVEGTVRTDPEAVRRAVGVEPGDPLFGLDVVGIRRAAERLPWVREARVIRQVPGTVRIVVTEWEPRYLIRTDRLAYLTAEGHVVPVPVAPGDDYPVITGVSPAQLRRRGEVRQALLELLGLLEGGLTGEDLGEVHVDPEEGITVYTDRRAVRFGLGGFGEKLERLARLDRHLSRTGQWARTVDLDYEDRIVARLEGPYRKGGRR